MTVTSEIYIYITFLKDIPKCLMLLKDYIIHHFCPYFKITLKKSKFLNLISCFLHSLSLTCTGTSGPDKINQ